MEFDLSYNIGSKYFSKSDLQMSQLFYKQQ